MLLLGKLDMKMKFKFAIVLYMITSCHSNMRENVHADKVITFKEEGIASISQDIDSVSYLPLDRIRWLIFLMEQKSYFGRERYLLGIYFNIKLLFIVMPESSCSR